MPNPHLILAAQKIITKIKKTLMLFPSRGYNKRMSNKQVQLEIFEQGHQPQKSNRPYVQTDAPVAQSQLPVRISVIAACSIIVFIAVFALGIERGKSLENTKNSAPDHEIIAENTQSPAEVTPKIPAVPITQPIQEELTPINKTLEKDKKNDTLNPSRYAIQIATYKKDSSYVKKEIAKLKQNGFKPLIKTSGDYMIIYAGDFENKETAQEQLKKLKKTYKDCFIKKI